MSLSKKIILASSVCAAFLAIGIGCSVEDRDLEGGIFKCQSDNDCLSGSQCVKAKTGDNYYGECTRDEDIVRCRDNDGDTYYAVVLTNKDRESGKKEEEFYNECGFTNDHPQDPDDTDPMVYPGATESCDKKDNSGDGCIDGIKDSNGNCQDLIQPCWGAGEYTDYDNGACSAENIGVRICKEGKLVHAVKDGNSFKVDDKKCPETIEELKNMTSGLGENMQYSDKDLKAGYDNNCDGIKDKKECKPKPETKCFVTKDQNREVTEEWQANYSKVVAKCGGNESDCACIGSMICVGDDLVCGKGTTAITKESVAGTECSKAFDSSEEN